MKNVKKGICKKRKSFYGMITITEKGQIAIPIGLRNELQINRGDKLMVIKRKDGKGINLVKLEAIDDFIEKFSNN